MAFETREFIVETLINGKPSRRGRVLDIVTDAEQRYAEPQRYYHTEKHIDDLVKLSEEHYRDLINPRVVLGAILLHDVIYDPTKSGGENEEQSAQLAERVLPNIMRRGLVAVAADYIRDTASHWGGVGDPDLNFFLDCDLSILGAEPERYDEYAADIRLEYAHVPDDLYNAGRAKILGGFARRASQHKLFVTDLFNEQYTEAATANIARELESLS